MSRLAESEVSVVSQSVRCECSDSLALEMKISQTANVFYKSFASRNS